MRVSAIHSQSRYRYLRISGKISVIFFSKEVMMRHGICFTHLIIGDQIFQVLQTSSCPKALLYLLAIDFQNTADGGYVHNAAGSAHERNENSAHLSHILAISSVGTRESFLNSLPPDSRDS